MANWEEICADLGHIAGLRNNFLLRWERADGDLGQDGADLGSTLW